MIFRRNKPQNEPDPQDREEIDYVLFQGPFNGVQPNLGANAKLAQAALVPTKELITDAILRRSEMIRLEPKGPAALVRLFVDGVPYPAAKMPRQQGAAITQMVKLLSGLDIRERGRPQSGGMKAEHDGTPYEIRVSTAPAEEGTERLTVRIENVKTRPEKPDELGIADTMRERIRELTVDKGLLLCCGPPGSGLTATTFGVLRSLDPFTRTIRTLGDPQGRMLVAITEFEWVQADGLETAIQRVIRTEPDVLYVDPIRDAAGAKLLFKYADDVTFVAEFAARDVAHGVAQLVQWTGSGETVTEGLRALVSPKLIRKLCDKCKQVFRPNPKALVKLGLPAETQMLYRPPKPPAPESPEAATYEPCTKCGGIGYFGRVGIFELLEMSPGMKEVVKAGATPQLVKQQMRADGMQTLQKEALRLVASGVTSLEEVQRVFAQPAG